MRLNQRGTRFGWLTAVVLSATLFPAVVPAAANSDPGETTHVDSVTATAVGNTIAVTGQATIVPPHWEATDPTGDVLLPGIGSDLEGISMVADAISEELVFEIDVADGPPPAGLVSELVRYDQCFFATLNALKQEGSRVIRLFRIQAFWPSELQGGPTFKLSNNCASAYEPSPIVQWVPLEGDFDDEGARFEVPFDLIGVGPDWVISHTQIPPGFRLGVSTLQGLCSYPPDLRDMCLDQIDGWIGPNSPIYLKHLGISLPSVALGIAPAGTELDQVPLTVEAELEPDGTFRGSLGRDHLSPGEYVVVARACYGDFGFYEYRDENNETQRVPSLNCGSLGDSVSV